MSATSVGFSTTVYFACVNTVRKSPPRSPAAPPKSVTAKSALPSAFAVKHKRFVASNEPSAGRNAARSTLNLLIRWSVYEAEAVTAACQEGNSGVAGIASVMIGGANRFRKFLKVMFEPKSSEFPNLLEPRRYQTFSKACL